MSKQREGRGALSPVVVFVGLLALVAAITAGVLLTREPGPPPPERPPEAFPDPTPTDHTLTDKEAIARFKELDALRIRAFERRRPGMLQTIFTSDSPARVRLRRSIEELRRQAAFADEQLEELAISVVRNELNEIVIRRVVILDIRFEDAAGNDITRSGREERQRVRWTLRPESGEWLLHEGTVTFARPTARQ